MSEITIIKADGQKEIFQQAKLVASLERAGASADLSNRVVAHIEHELINGMSSADIYHHAFSVLQKEREHGQTAKQVAQVAARYSLRRALIGFGPTGFPFEEYVAEIFKAQGFSVLNDRVLQGACVEHEVDVVAWNERKLAMVEVKFHNELGLKSDLKVALYVKARFDDLRAASAGFFFGGRERALDEGWLITNTKFSDHALRYGQCVGLNMIGWNYPKHSDEKRANAGTELHGNLQALIERFKLHPVSCLTSLTVAHKQELFSKKIVLCRSLVEDPSILQSLGLTSAQVSEVSEEIAALTA